MNVLFNVLYVVIALLVLCTTTIIYFVLRQRDQYTRMDARWSDLTHLLTALNNARVIDQQHASELKESLIRELAETRHHLDQYQFDSLKMLQDSLQQGLHRVNERLNQVIEHTQRTLYGLTQTVEGRLADGFAKTTATFTDIHKRLALIDEAQKRMAELSKQMLTLQQILGDKRLRGVLGETQLSALIQNVLPSTHFNLQHTLSNGKRVDCILFLPKPTGHIAIDAKFPLESFKQLMDDTLSETDKRKFEQRFRHDVLEHIQAVASKYIVPGETSDGAILFIPAESIFAEIHARYPDLIEQAHTKHVWLASPTTMMAILNTARAVLKDAATREQIHLIQRHLRTLSVDFFRFQQRMDNLTRHIHQAHTDLQEVKISSDKIVHRFEKIEKVDLATEHEQETA